MVDAYETGTLDYVITINTGDLPSGGSLTTDNVEAATFTASGQADAVNDFGYKTTTLVADAGLPATICVGDNTTLTASETADQGAQLDASMRRSTAAAVH